MFGDMLALFGLGCLVLSPFAFFQIITKAGFSGWWTFVPYSPWIVGILGVGIFKAVDTNQSIGTTLNQISLWDVAMFLTSVFVIVMFFVFAFSAWPSLQNSGRRQRLQSGRPNGGGPSRPSWINAPAPVAASPDGAPAPPPSPTGTAAAPGAAQAQPSGWYRAGAVGSGEQGYWDGQAWTARRQWRNGAWVDLPMPSLDPVEAPTVDSN